MLRGLWNTIFHISVIQLYVEMLNYLLMKQDGCFYFMTVLRNLIFTRQQNSDIAHFIDFLEEFQKELQEFP